MLTLTKKSIEDISNARGVAKIDAFREAFYLIGLSVHDDFIDAALEEYEETGELPQYILDYVEE